MLEERCSDGKFTSVLAPLKRRSPMISTILHFLSSIHSPFPTLVSTVSRAAQLYSLAAPTLFFSHYCTTITKLHHCTHPQKTLALRTSHLSIAAPPIIQTKAKATGQFDPTQRMCTLV